jgi:hypothetical protein
METMIPEGTIYVGGVFGFKKIEARDIIYGFREYAQYTECVFVEFNPKGKRKRWGLNVEEKPKIVILQGWNHPDPNPIYTQDPRNPNLMMTKISCSPEIDDEFNGFFDGYVSKSNCKVLVDYRGYVAKRRPSSGGLEALYRERQAARRKEGDIEKD